MKKILLRPWKFMWFKSGAKKWEILVGSNSRQQYTYCSVGLIRLHPKSLYKQHCWFLEPWNKEESLTLIWQRFSCILNEWIKKMSKIIFFSWWLFEIIHIIRFEMRMASRINLKIFLGFDINYLSIWPLMRHPWFPTRKASKPTFTCFQLAR